MKKTLGQIAEMIGATLPNKAFQDVIVEGASINTRTIQKMNLFIPFKGENVDGHAFVEQAFEKGAAATLWQEDVENPPQDAPLLLVKDSELALQELARAYRQQSS